EPGTVRACRATSETPRPGRAIARSRPPGSRPGARRRAPGTRDGRWLRDRRRRPSVDARARGFDSSPDEAHGNMRRDRRMTATGALREPLERLYREFDYGARISRDAIEFPLRYAAADDRELVALLTTCLAYGRVDLFGRALEGVLRIMAPSPAAFVRDFDAQRDGGAFASFIYRFNRPRDLVAFCVAARDLLARHGSLEKCFGGGGGDPAGPPAPALQRV